MYLPKNHPILDHKFVTGLELLELYRKLQRCCLPVFEYVTLSFFGIKILNKGQTRFPENEVFYDLERSMLGNVHSALLHLEYVYFSSVTKLTIEDKCKEHPKLEKALHQLQQIIDMNKVDPSKGYYNRECFEEHFDLKWIENDSTS